jgi:hypothetical protein
MISNRPVDVKYYGTVELVWMLFERHSAFEILKYMQPKPFGYLVERL